MSTGALARWQARFLDLNACPWPGPRPLLDSQSRRAQAAVRFTEQDLAEARPTEEDLAEARRQLRGRDLEVDDLATTCISSALVVLHGQSGVGKSSIINAGLVPELQSSGQKVILCKNWGVSRERDETGPDPEVLRWPEVHDFLTRAARREGLLHRNPFEDGVSAVDRDFPNQLVFILDQFEELIRSEPGFAHKVLQWIQEVAGRTTAKFVISLRSEYEYQLRDLYTAPFAKRARVEISPITDIDTIRAVIAGDSEYDETDVMPITDDARDELVRLWSAGQSDDTTFWSRPGLLHLQAALYVLWQRRDKRDGGLNGSGEVTKKDVEDLCAAWATRRSKRPAGASEDGDDSVLGFALERSVQVAIDNCIKSCDRQESTSWPGVADVVSDQTRWIFRDVTEHLASGGYKTHQDIWDLAHKVLSYLDEPVLRQTPAWAPSLYQAGDWLSARRSAYGLDDTPVAARSSIANGPAAALGIEELLFELYRCYFFALEWMRHANIVQILPSGSSQRVTLTHDRFSEGLAAWRESEAPDFKEAVGRYVAHRGKSDLSWPSLESGLSHDRLVVNVRWEQCVIRGTEFRDVTFVNCDFAGATFDGCTFDGAVFVNCVLDDVDFVGCTIKRAPEWRFANEQWLALDPDVRRPLVEDPPTFRAHVDRLLADRLTALLPEEPVDSLLVESPPSGSGAVVASVVPDRPADAPTLDPEPVRPEMPEVRGGLVMCGGRLSSLTFRRCTFCDDEAPAKVVLRHVAGTSLEICEQTHGTFDVFAAAARGLAVTLPVGTVANAANKFTFDVRHAKVINTWLGVNLVGTATFTDCNVWQLINASQEMKVRVVNSAFFGLINTGEVTDGKSRPLGHRDFTENGLSAEAVESVRQVSVNIDVQED